MNYQRLFSGFIIAMAMFFTTSLVARAQEQITDAVAIETPSVTVDVPQKTFQSGPQKLSWKEWVARGWPKLKAKLLSASEDSRTLAFLVGVYIMFLLDPSGQMQAVKNLTVPTVLSTVVMQYLRYFLVNAAHEGGHALVNYAFTGKVSDIYLGAAVSDGVEIVPHVILAGLDPSRGVTTGMANPMLSDELLDEKKLRQVLENFQKQYPTKSLDELADMFDFKQACKNARGESEVKTISGRLRMFALVAAGAIAGLITNGLIKLGMGESAFSVDHVDILQLRNLYFATGLDGGVIAKKVFGWSGLVDASGAYYEPAMIAAFFVKALLDFNAQNQNSHPAWAIFHALGLALMNYGTNGFMHFTGK